MNRSRRNVQFKRLETFATQVSFLVLFQSTLHNIFSHKGKLE